MSKMMVIVSETNDVLGTLVMADTKRTNGAPKSFGIRSQPGTRLLEIDVDESLLAMEPDDLHAAIAERHLNAASKLMVLVNGKNEVLGTLAVSNSQSGRGGPKEFGMRARDGERVIEIAADPALAGLSPAKLHSTIAERHLR